MIDHKYKGQERLMQQRVNLHGVRVAAKLFGASEESFRKSCHFYGIKIPESKPDLSENHPKVIKWIKRRNVVMLSVPFGNV